MKKQERSDQILESAARLFASRRFDEVLMDDIAHEAGVAKGTLYRYFQDKEELYFAVIFGGISRLNEQLQSRAGTPTDPEERLWDMMRAIVSFFRQNRFFFRLMSIEDGKTEGGHGVNRHRWHKERHRQIEAIQTVLEAGVATGVFAIPHPRTQAQVLRGMVRSVLTSGEADLTVDEMVDLIMRTFLHGIRTNP